MIYCVIDVRKDFTFLLPYLHDHGAVLDVHGELVGVPAQVRGPRVGVNGPQHPESAIHHKCYLYHAIHYNCYLYYVIHYKGYA